MNSSNVFKLLEYCILPHFNRCLKINSRQFAYRAGVGCLTSASILKETVSYYKRSNIHCCLIDYSKAYDKTNYKILLSKLIHTELSRDLILLMKCMFENSFIGVRFNGICSKKDFRAKNGIRQGGICPGLLYLRFI